MDHDKKINPAHLLRKAKNSEHVAFGMSVTTYLAPRVASIPGLSHSWTKYNTTFFEEEGVFKHNPKAEKTEAVVAAHKKRYNSVRALTLQFDAAALSEDPEIQAAGKECQYAVGHYNYSSRMPYTEQTSVVDNIVVDLKSARYAQFVNKLNLMPAVNTVDANNKHFESIYDERSLETHAKTVKEAMAKIRPKVDKNFNAMADDINTLYASNEILGQDPALREILGDVIYSINSFTEQLERVISRRLGKGKSKGKGDNSDDEDEDNEEDDNTEDQPSGVPHLIMTDQQVQGQSYLGDTYGSQTTAKAVNKAAFNAALYPAATGGIVKIIGYADVVYDFPIAGFLMDESGQQATGLILNAPHSGMSFHKPIDVFRTDTSEAWKDDQLLATFEGIGFPQYISED